MGIPGVESYKTFRILVEVEGGGVPLGSGDPMIWKSGDRKTRRAYRGSTRMGADPGKAGASSIFQPTA